MPQKQKSPWPLLSQHHGQPKMVLLLLRTKSGQLTTVPVRAAEFQPFVVVKESILAGQNCLPIQLHCKTSAIKSRSSLYHIALKYISVQGRCSTCRNARTKRLKQSDACLQSPRSACASPKISTTHAGMFCWTACCMAEVALSAFGAGCVGLQSLQSSMSPLGG